MSTKLYSVSDLELLHLEHIKQCRFRTDPKRPYISRAVSRHFDRALFVKKYELSAWNGTKKWFGLVSRRCELIEKITLGRTIFLLSSTVLYRISVPVQGLHRCGSTYRINDFAYAKLVRLILDAHSLGVVHGDISVRNIRARAECIDLFDWEPILIAPGSGAAQEPVPEHISDTCRWLGACDLLPQLREKASVYEIDYKGLENIKKHFSETTINHACSAFFTV